MIAQNFINENNDYDENVDDHHDNDVGDDGGNNIKKLWKKSKK